MNSLAVKSFAVTAGLTAVTLTGVFAAAASVDCTCRAPGGVDVPLGQTVCLPTGRAARCIKVLNNTSWQFLPGPCSRPT